MLHTDLRSVACQHSGQRLFLALWPDPTLQTEIFNFAESLNISSARLLNVKNLHLTLLFLGQVEAEQQHCLERLVGTRLHPDPDLKFDLALDRLTYRFRQRMLWLQPGSTPDALLILVTVLRQIATDCGLKIDSRPFLAHMTLLRKVMQAPLNLPTPDFV